VYPLFIAIDTIQSVSGAPLRLHLRVGIHCLQLRCVVDLHCIPVEIFPNARRHCRLYHPSWISHRIRNRFQRCLHKISYRPGQLIFYTQFKSVCSPYRSQILRLHHCRLFVVIFCVHVFARLLGARFARLLRACFARSAYTNPPYLSRAFFRAPTPHTPTNMPTYCWLSPHSVPVPGPSPIRCGLTCALFVFKYWLEL
jgi:hypothetical protein